MILDTELQRLFLLEMFKQVSFPGQALDVAYAIKQAITSAATTEGVNSAQAAYDAAVDARP